MTQLSSPQSASVIAAFLGQPLAGPVGEVSRIGVVTDSNLKGALAFLTAKAAVGLDLESLDASLLLVDAEVATQVRAPHAEGAHGSPRKSEARKA